VEDGLHILSNVVATQIDIHTPFSGVVPEIASRTHTEWIWEVTEEGLSDAGVDFSRIDGISVTNRPGMIGSLLVGVCFAKGLAFSLTKPLVGVDHILAHLYAIQLEKKVEYPYLGVLVSGGHTLICIVRDCTTIQVLGTTIDDACGEAYDKVAKHFGLGYPGGAVIDSLAQKGDPKAFTFPLPSLHKGDHAYDVSYSGLKTAVINQLDQFHNRDYDKTNENIAAAFQHSAITMLTDRVKRAVKDTGIPRIVAGGGVAANSLLRKHLRDLAEVEGIEVYFPSLSLCTDNAAMIAGLGFHLIQRGETHGMELNAVSRVKGMRKTYP
jgi:N6-L-threonylcarbamoyladenine synthase